MQELVETTNNEAKKAVNLHCNWKTFVYATPRDNSPPARRLSRPQHARDGLDWVDTLTKKEREKMKKFLIMTVILTSMVAATSCNVTRTITNESQYYQRGDTSVVIQTKTIETYDASKR